jgi:hypothetical protein
MPSYFFLPELYISFLEVGRKRRQCYDMPWWGTKHHCAIWEYHSRSTYELCFISKDYKNSKLLRCENGKRWLCFRAVSFLYNSRRYDRHSTYPTSTRYVFTIIVMLVLYLELLCLYLLYPNLCSGRAKIQVWGSWLTVLNSYNLTVKLI